MKDFSEIIKDENLMGLFIEKKKAIQYCYTLDLDFSKKVIKLAEKEISDTLDKIIDKIGIEQVLSYLMKRKEEWGSYIIKKDKKEKEKLLSSNSMSLLSSEDNYDGFFN